MHIKDILKSKGNKVITISESSALQDAMKLLIENKISCLPVVDGNDRILGIISDKDIFKQVYYNKDNFISIKTSEVMSKDVIVGVEDDTVDYISNLMTKNRIRHIPIVENNCLIGLISIGDIVKVRQKDMEIENRYLREYITGNYPG